jgi:hypothetical protein
MLGRIPPSRTVRVEKFILHIDKFMKKGMGSDISMP